MSLSRLGDDVSLIGAQSPPKFEKDIRIVARDIADDKVCGFDLLENAVDDETRADVEILSGTLDFGEYCGRLNQSFDTSLQC